MRHGGKILVDQLERLGVERVFSVPGESFLAVLDGLHDSGIQNVVCRHEGGAAMMAEAMGKMSLATGGALPGVAFVTRGPGACNASAGVHVAAQDSTPMVLFVGQIARGDRDREAFQEVDYRAMFGGMTKWVAEVEETARLPEYVARAFRVACAGRPGPVVLALPEDVLSGAAEVADAIGPGAAAAGPEAAAFDPILTALRAAKRPLVVVGGPHWSEDAGRDLATFAEAWDLPIAVSFRRQPRLDTAHPCFAGELNVGINPKLAQRMRQADCLLLIGTRLGDIETQGYTLLAPAAPGKTVLHVHPGAEEIGQVWGTAASVVCTAPDALRRLVDTKGPGWPDWRTAARADFEGWVAPQESPGAVKLEEVVTWLSREMPEDAIVTNGAGNYAGWVARYMQFGPMRELIAPTSGSMGYGFPAAVAASLAHPAREVVCFAGDGCFQMTLNEMSTAVQYGAKPIVIVCNNGRYGTIRMHQEKQYPGRVSGTDLANPDFAALARAYGGFGVVVEEGAAFAEAYRSARDSGGIAVIELRLDGEALTTGATLSAVRGQRP